MPRSTSKKTEQPYRRLRNTSNILSLYETSSEATSSDTTPHETDVLTLRLRDIYIEPNRVRKYFDSNALSSLANSMQTHGFIGTIVVRPNPNETQALSQPYVLVAGGRRYAAAKLAGLETLRAIVADLTEEQALEFELIENLQREDLNPIEETKGILQLLSKRLQLEETQVIALFQRHAYLQQNIDIQNTDAEFSQHWQTIEQLFEVIGKFTPDSFRVNRLPLLNLPEPILAAVSQGQLEYSKARLIARVKDESIQGRLLQQAIDEGLSQAQIQQTIQQLNQQLDQQSRSKTPAQLHQIQTRATGIAKTLKKSQVLASLSKRDQAKVEKLLDQLWEIISPEKEQ
ncbi:MAG: ParB/RepB/Spo0J family partition protein [Elainella sp. C42_A2020_010]|nr:ParB/RepB/Spo0J family partition protein [Elainella sp. C42_A2020_010]